MKKINSEPSRHEIWKMFDKIAATYDNVNRVMTCGCDRYWRKKMTRFLPDKEKIHLLDCATGTGDQIFSLVKDARIEKAIGIDLSEEMLGVARTKASLKKVTTPVSFQGANLLNLPFPESTFDCVTISFGIRNVTDVALALRECNRVLKSTGRLLILEGTIPENKAFRPLVLFYLRHILPRIGGVISKNKNAYRYLNETMETFPAGEKFCTLLRSAGFTNVAACPLTGGVATIYLGDK